ncbi:hypothetical protein ABZY68_25260 [Streptomyces sp. NPDC006482]|uniref:hypothetical protein n=1 Tax=Streptomyces sp. NPDC006482 TaxID=3154306 RepID=UPI0033AB4663
MPMPRCPRCGGPLGSDPAQSRMQTVRTVRICVPCGTDEAVRDHQGHAPVPPTDWPIGGTRT